MTSEINGKVDENEKSNNPTINNPINFSYPNPYSLTYPPMLSSGYPLGNSMINYPFSYPFVPYLGGSTLLQPNGYGQGCNLGNLPFPTSINNGQAISPIANESLSEANNYWQANTMRSDGILSPQNNNDGQQGAMGSDRIRYSQDNRNCQENDVRDYRSRQRFRSRSRSRSRSRDRSPQRQYDRSPQRQYDKSPQRYMTRERNRYGISYDSNHDTYRHNLSSSSHDIDDRHCLSRNDKHQKKNSTYKKMKIYVNARGCRDRTIHLKLRYCTEAELRNHLSTLIIRTQIEIKRIWTDDHIERSDVIAPIAMIILDSKESVSEMLRIIENGSKKLIVKATEFDWNHNIRS